jgi:DNA-binding NtrC family response regulator
MSGADQKAALPVVLVVEDDAAHLQLLQEELEDGGYAVSAATDVEAAWRRLQETPAELVISDLRLPGENGLALMHRCRQLPAPPAFVAITAFGTIEQAVAALKQGADDFLTKPLDLEHLQVCVRRVLETRRLRREVEGYRQILGKDDFHGIIGRSACMRELFGSIRRVAQASGPVLLLGESGAGKELVARAIHAESPRAGGPFVAVNCAGIPSSLLESELFGHATGAFTGAARSRKGLFVEADAGSMLLDEIGEMSGEMQAKLLRILEDGKVRPLGSNHEQAVNVRVIAATHRDLEVEVKRGRFREDLFFRLETFPLAIPPLRERGDDVDLLAARFIALYAARLGCRVEGITPAALARLKSYSFPGNVRELSNAIERAVTFCRGPQIDLGDLPERLQSAPPAAGSEPGPDHAMPLDPGEPLPTLENLERRYVRRVLRQVGNNKQRAAEILGIGRRTLYRYLGEPD